MNNKKLNAAQALLIIDVQNDFLPGGSLAVEDGFAIIPIINQVHTGVKWDMVVVSQDWHPKGHLSFSSRWVGKPDTEGKPIVAGGIHVFNERGYNETLWPDHCLQGEPGALFHKDLHISGSDHIVKKGTNPEVDSYSAFADNNQKNLTPLYQLLDAQHIQDVYVCGIATDFCVNFTCRDARVRKDADQCPGRNSFNTHLIVDACRGVDKPGSEKAVEELRAPPFNVSITTSSEVLRIFGSGPDAL